MVKRFCKSFAITLVLQGAFNSAVVLGLWKLDALKQGVEFGKVLLFAIGVAAFCAILSGVASVTPSFLSKTTE